MYGPTEVNAFARGLAHLTGVTIKLRSGQPHTDGSTVWLDSRTTYSRGEFDAQCGVGCHEVSHVYFGTVQTAVPWSKSIADSRGVPDKHWLAHECANVVLDIQDETRFEHVMPAAKSLFRIFYLHSSGVLYDDLRHYHPPSHTVNGVSKPLLPVWRAALLSALLTTRLGTARNDTWSSDMCPLRLRMLRCVVRYRCRREFGNDGLKEVFTLLLSCREKQPRSHRGNFGRLATSWKAIRRRVEKLFDLVLPYVQDSDKQPQPQPDADGQTVVDANDPMGEVRKGRSVQGDGRPSGVPQPGGTPPPGAPAGNSSDSSSRTVEFDVPFYRRACHGLAKSAAELMETHDSMRMTRRDITGHKLGRRWTSLFTDGAVYLNPEVGTAEELSLALLVDKSSSTRRVSGRIFAAAKALAVTMHDLGANVDCWLFGASCEHRRWHDLDSRVSLEGDTLGETSVIAANRWLMTHPSGRKLCVVLTDGSLGDGDSSQAQMRSGASLGIEYVLIGLGIPLDKLRYGWMSGLPSVVCDDPSQLGEILVRTVIAQCV